MQPNVPKPTRCAIYTRKSTDEGLERDFNSLDAQRECAEAYIKSQQQELWTAVPDKYDDGGFTGANIERPALRRLLADIEAGKIDCVVVYKVDRLSRSLLDFARIMEVFEKRNISFVSVTQQMNTTTPMGRLTLNVLFSFAQFEREVISERTRDKMVAARRKGKWTGGTPPLGYDADPATRKLVVNEIEAQQVRTIFQLFVKNQSLAETLKAIRKRGFRTKSWTTRDEKHRVGTPFNRPRLTHLLKNVLYIGQVTSAGSTYPGEQSAIVDPAVWQQANEILSERKRGSSGRERTRHSPLLEGRLTCAICEKSMTHGYTTKKGRRYRYYRCQTACKGGDDACAKQIISAAKIEHALLRKIDRLAGDPLWPKIKHALRLHPAEWSSLSAAFQHSVFDQFVESVRYSHATDDVLLTLRAVFVEPDQNPQVSITVYKDASGKRYRPAADAHQERLPAIALSMAMAIRFERMLEQGEFSNLTEIARHAGVSTSRVSQILRLRNLAPSIQEHLLAMTEESPNLSELAVRKIADKLDWSEQVRLFAAL